MATEKKSVPEEQVSVAEDVKMNATQECAPEAAPESESVSPAEEAAPEITATEESASEVSFAEEEAALDAAAAGLEIGEEELTAEEQNHEAASEDLSSMSKAEIVDYFGALLEKKPVQHLRADVENIKIAFYKLHRSEVDAARKKFIEEGGSEDAFAPQPDEQEQRLKEYFGRYRSSREEYISSLETVKEENLKIKLQIIEELKELVNSNETINQTFATFRSLQQRWKETGMVPQAHNKEIWETYNLHVENFYNYIKINKELRDLDLKRNYEAKVQLCEEVEALVMEPSVVSAFRKLQDLHEQWRETGPVAAEYKESLWERFKEASSRINKQHQEYFEGVKEEQKRNLELKTELCVKAEELSEAVITSRKEWNDASAQLIEIQKVWKTIGFAPKKDNTKIYERFRNACDRFFELKHSFYANVKSEMEANLQLKNEICEAAEALKNSDQWKKTTDELIALQKRWKEIGPVSRRYSDAVWKRFRAACDEFFARKSAHFSGVDEQHVENLAKKEALLNEMAEADITAGGFEAIKEFQRRWSEIGFVPIKAKETIQKKYKEVVDAMFATLRGGEKERSMDRFRNRINTLKSNGERRLRTEREKLYNKVKQLEQDIATLENNIGFFSRSKNAEAMIHDVEEKIAAAKAEMAELIEKVNLIDKEN